MSLRLRIPQGFVSHQYVGEGSFTPPFALLFLMF